MNELVFLPILDVVATKTTSRRSICRDCVFENIRSSNGSYQCGYTDYSNEYHKQLPTIGCSNQEILKDITNEL